MCVVEVKGARNLVAACVHPVSEGMEVYDEYTEADFIQKEDIAALVVRITIRNVCPVCAAVTVNCSSSARELWRG